MVFYLANGADYTPVCLSIEQGRPNYDLQVTIEVNNDASTSQLWMFLQD